MTEAELRAAIIEAKRFVRLAEQAARRLRDDRLIAISGCKETAAARRASMDLSRALSELRRA